MTAPRRRAPTARRARRRPSRHPARRRAPDPPLPCTSSRRSRRARRDGRVTGRALAAASRSPASVAARRARADATSTRRPARFSRAGDAIGDHLDLGTPGRRSTDRRAPVIAPARTAPSRPAPAAAHAGGRPWPRAAGRPRPWPPRPPAACPGRVWTHRATAGRRSSGAPAPTLGLPRARPTRASAGPGATGARSSSTCAAGAWSPCGCSRRTGAARRAACASGHRAPRRCRALPGATVTARGPSGPTLHLASGEPRRAARRAHARATRPSPSARSRGRAMTRIAALAADPPGRRRLRRVGRRPARSPRARGAAASAAQLRAAADRARRARRDPRRFGYRSCSPPARRDMRGRLDPRARTITLFVDPHDATHRIAHDLAHELGHAYDLAHLTRPTARPTCGAGACRARAWWPSAERARLRGRRGGLRRGLRPLPRREPRVPEPAGCAARRPLWDAPAGARTRA